MKRSCDDDSDEIPGGSDSDQETEESWAEEDRLSSPVLHNRKRRRGMVEKMRRDRINNCLAELKYLVPAALSQERRGGSKLEKAEVLELTVDYVRNLIRKGEYRALFPDDHANLSRPCYSFDSKANLSHGRESRYPRDRCVSLDCMAGFSECAHQITAHLASLTADNPELKGIQTTLLTHVQHVFKRNFLGHKDCPTYAPSGEHSAHVHRSKPSFAETLTISALDESGELGKTNISKESGKTVSEDDRPPFDTTEGFRPYKKTSNHLSSDQRDVLDERKLPHDKDRKATSSTSKGFPEMLEQLRRRLTATSCSSAQKLSGSVQCKQTTSAISTGIPTNHSFAHEVMQASFPDIDLRPYETSHATSGCFKSTIAKHEQYKLNSWQNLRYARVRKPSVPLTTQHAVRPTWFILPPLHQSGLSPGVEGPLPAAIRDLVPLQMALSLPSPLAFDSALHQPGGHWSRGIK